jgi:hypothetical protein
MLKFVNDILSAFRPCFSRNAAYEWFVVIIMGLMVRSDHLGVTSIIRDLMLNPRHYESWTVKSSHQTIIENRKITQSDESMISLGCLNQKGDD